MMNYKPKLVVELLENFKELESFSCGEKQMDDFIGPMYKTLWIEVKADEE